jgi:hypothetical protein
MASAFVTAHVLSSSALLQNEDKDFCFIFIYSKSMFDLDLTCYMQSPFPPQAQEKSSSHIEQKEVHFTLFRLSQTRKYVFVTFLVSLTVHFWWLWIM